MSIYCSSILKKSISYCTSLGSFIYIFSIITLAVDPFSIVNISINSFLFISYTSYLISLSVSKCCINLPPAKCEYESQCSWHWLHKSENISLIYCYFKFFRIFCFDDDFIFWLCYRTVGLHFAQKHCSMLCQLTIGPYKAKISIRSFMQECSRFGGCKNCWIDLNVIL